MMFTPMRSLFIFQKPVFALMLAWCASPLYAQVQGSGMAAVATGQITDAVTRQPLRGIRISYRELTAAITDSAGNFSISVPHAGVTILATGEGFQTKELALRGSTKVSAALHEKEYPSLYNDVTTPFGVVMQSHTSFAATAVETQGNWQGTPETPDAYLQGKVAGLRAVRRSGTPNTGADLFLRGFSSLYATNQPLIIVDGVFFDIGTYGNPLTPGYYNNPLAFIDTKDIDNITVLKDGSAVYGAKGANGVICITTARARQEATKIDAALYGGVNMAPAKIPVMDTRDYRLYLGEMLQSKGLSDKATQALPYMNDDTASAEYYRNHYNNHWQNQVLQSSYVQNGYLKITGGDNIARYALSIGFLKNDGVIKNTGLTRYNTRFNADLNLSRRLTAAANLSFVYNEQRLKNTGLSLTTNPLFAALVKAPFLPANDVADNGIESPSLADKDTFNVSNPVALIRNMQALNKNYRFTGSVDFNYLLVKNLTLGSTIGVTVDKIRESFFVPQRGIVGDTLSNAVAFNRSGAQVIRNFTVFNDSRLAYTRAFSKVHRLDARIGMRYVRSRPEQDNGFGFNAATDQLTGVGYGLNTLRQIGGSLGEWTWLNSYVYAGYQATDKYFLSVTMAADGSSRFGNNVSRKNAAAIYLSGRPFALFPSISGAWLVSSEKFMAHHPFIQLLKFRASAGLTGNDDIGNFTARKYYVPQNLLGISGLVRGNTGNEQLQWEAVTKVNAGMDVSLFNERLSITLDAYRNTTGKMIVYEPVTASSGMNYSITNSGGMKTTGWEATLHARALDKTRFTWDVGFTIAQYTSRITRLPSKSILTGFAGGAIITQAGSAPNLFYGYATRGVYPSDAAAAASGLILANADGSRTAFRGGDMQFVNTSGNDNIIDDNDRQVIGDPNPDYYGGISSRLVYRNWSLEAFFNFSKGNDVYNYTRRQLESMSGYANQTEAVIRRWRTNGQLTDIPRATWGDPAGNSRFSDRWIEDGSYLRLKNVTLAYNIPIRPGAVKNINIYLTGNNVLTFTRYLGYDPEFSATTSVFGQGVDVLAEPQFRSAQAGVRIGL